MSFLESFILAVALAMDALIVSFSYGLVVTEKKILNALSFGLFFGVFQGLMPILGWYLTGFVYSNFAICSKWISFIVFFILGCKFLKDAIEEDGSPKIICVSLVCLIMLSITTSIDALVSGISIRFENADIISISLVVGIVTFVLSTVGFLIASALKKLPSRYLQISGGLLLIYLSIKAII